MREYMRATTLQTPRSIEEEEGGAPSTRADIPLQSMVHTMVKQLCPCSPWRSMGQQSSAEAEQTLENCSNAQSSLCLCGNSHRNRLLAGLVDAWREESTIEQACWKDWWLHWSRGLEVLKDCRPQKGPTGTACEELHWRSWWRTASHGRDLVLEQRKNVRSLLPERKEQQRRRVMNRMQPPFPVLLCHNREGGSREFDKWQQEQTEIHKVPPDHEEKLLYFEGIRALEQAAQRGYESPPEYDPVQAALGEAALAGWLDYADGEIISRDPFNPNNSVIL
ncbi:hypothetical protein TURU_083028 [Turdus rufiventris]|nr:hypothetical protein TURU_083028 [Turdus rufiventris]